MTRLRDFLSAFVAKFFKDGLPVALAGAIGALLVGQFNRPAPIVVQAPAPVVAQPAPVVHERVVEELKRDAEPRPVAAQAVAKSMPVERKSRTGAPEKAARSAPIADKKVAAAEPLPTSVPPPSPLAAPVVIAPSAPPPVAAALAPPEPRATEWVGLLPLPTRVTGTTDRALDDAPVPPLPVPMPYDGVGARM